MFFVLKKKSLILLVAALLFVLLTASTGLAFSVLSARPTYLVVIDAGHGGSDGGVLGSTHGTKEAEINLSLAKKLQTELEKKGVLTILTRETDAALSDGLGGTKKQQDMRVRKKTILDASPHAVVSLHCNSFPQDPKRRGAQAFFYASESEGARLANEIQQSLNPLNKITAGKTYQALAGNYFILKCAPMPSVLVECGFLSNPQDENLLASQTHQEDLAKAITKGILSYLSSC